MSGARGSFVIAMAFICLAWVSPAAATVAEPFPQYACIEANVGFWTDVYAKYTTAQGIVHDSIDLRIIYDVIDLKPYNEPGARKINRARMKRALRKYKAVLARLSRDPNCADAECTQVAGLFGDKGRPAAFQKAANRIRCQVGQKDRFVAGLIRSGAYLDQIRNILRSHGVPEDLAYLPHVESSFNPNAYSKFGAAGMWQFTRGTGKLFMQIDYVLDERRDPIIATHAAARLLKENFEKLQSWPLAITAYNHGSAGMKRAKAMHGDYPAIFRSYRGRVFKFASRNFYSEFLAARQVAENYQDYFGDLVLDRPGRTRTIVLKDYVALSDLQRHLKVAPEILAELNPALRPPVFNGQKYIPKGYKLRLPETATMQQPDVIAQLPEDIYKSSQKPSRFYTVQAGDTAGRIARMHGVRLSDLALANNLNRRATIYARQTLRIPQPGDQMPPLKPGAPTQPADKTDTHDTVRLAESALPANETQKPLSDASERERYPAPVLASILPIAAIAHNEKPDRPQPAIADLEKPNLEIVTADVRFENVLNENGRPVGILQVEVEETLGHYAEWAKVRTHQIRRLNAMRFGDVLHLHQRIKIPLQRTTVQLFEETRYEYHKRLQEDFFAVYRLGELSAYRIERGDSVWTLCRKKFDIPMWLLKHSNPELDLAELRMNQKIWIPTIEKATLDEPLVGDGSEGEDPGTGQAEPEQAEPDQAETEQSELNQVENDEAL